MGEHGVERINLFVKGHLRETQPIQVHPSSIMPSKAPKWQQGFHEPPWEHFYAELEQDTFPQIFLFPFFRKKACTYRIMPEQQINDAKNSSCQKTCTGEQIPFPMFRGAQVFACQVTPGHRRQSARQSQGIQSSAILGFLVCGERTTAVMIIK